VKRGALSRRVPNSGLRNNVTVTVDGMENSSWKVHKKSRRQKGAAVVTERYVLPHIVIWKEHCSSQLPKDKNHTAGTPARR
jgi:hypothetical protein